MNEIIQNWEEIGIANDFLFGKIMRNPELYKGRKWGGMSI